MSHSFFTLFLKVLHLDYIFKGDKIKLVISEAGPTYFYKENEDLTGQDEIITDENICAMVGIDYKGENYVYQHKNEEHLNYQEDLEDITALWNASPLKYATSNAPYTILAYGINLNTPPDNPTFTSGDTLVPYSHATAVYNELGSGKCSRFELTGVNHNQFGDDENSTYSFTVCPTSTDEMVYEYYYGKEENGQIVIPGLQQLINSHLFGNN